MKRLVKATMAAAAGCALVMGGASAVQADAVAHGAAIGSPGVLSGNVIQIPIHVPINICGNSVNLAGALNPAIGNVCVNH
ncbi:chaplin [Streptomyces alkaliterrae]|uniref:Chaplin n=1 Tax=Streptomyces alkaliterrae TaxID=2213162 RepID=A0A5P0YQP0_9ACTN|nr:chaplin [Streptomyces alkaliterrae]MBB1254226.1 chaplin [Streptomyces alkaliterrae]MBB1258065.1 chaplin [Streptomyces alkaliterrae]MQS02626.1 DUF320 domain-containing protein [Streptomyces alkaliterrae]